MQMVRFDIGRITLYGLGNWTPENWNGSIWGDSNMVKRRMEEIKQPEKLSSEVFKLIEEKEKFYKQYAAKKTQFYWVCYKKKLHS